MIENAHDFSLRIIQLVNPLITTAGFECIEAEWVPHESVLRIFIDKNDGDPNLDDCATVSRMLDEHEELENTIPGTYRFEVSSPGIERPLRLEKDFGDSLGKRAKITLCERVDGRAKGTGEIQTVDHGQVSLATEQGDWVFPITKVKKARILYNWDSP